MCAVSGVYMYVYSRGAKEYAVLKWRMRLANISFLFFANRSGREPLGAPRIWLHVVMLRLVEVMYRVVYVNFRDSWISMSSYI